jgi:hypothetical protein
MTPCGTLRDFRFNNVGDATDDNRGSKVASQRGAGAVLRTSKASSRIFHTDLL